MMRSAFTMMAACAIGIPCCAQEKTRATSGLPGKSKSVMRVGAAQPKNRTIDFRLKPADVLLQVEKSLAELGKIVDQAGQAGCDALAFPEDTLGLLKWLSANSTERTNVLPAAVQYMLDRLGSAARKYSMYLVCCSDALGTDGGMRNTAFFLGRDGKVIGRYVKVHPTIHDSRKRGNEFPVFLTPDLGGVGMLICYDMVFPESVRCLALGGADVIFHPTLGGAAIGDEDVSRAAFRTRAVDNFVYVVVSQRDEGSMIVSPQGKVLVEGKGRDDIAIADIDPFGGREGGDSFDQQKDMRARLFRERNTPAYGILTDPNPPVLAKVPATITPAEAARIFEKGLTVGEEEFKAADSLRNAGRTAEAIDAFQRLRVEYKGSWIDRVAEQRLARLRTSPQARSTDLPR
jgi:predicted amidohydrolase